MYHPDDLCPYCRQPLGEREDDLLSFTFVGYGPGTEPLAGINDGAVHRACLGRHPRRDEIVAAWNAIAEPALGPEHMLEVTRSGDVQYLGWWSRWQCRRERWSRVLLTATARQASRAKPWRRK